MNVRALTVRSPWSCAIIDGHKPVENRSGGFQRSYTGLLLIHSATGISRRGIDDDRIHDAYPEGAPLVFSAVLGWVELLNSHNAEEGCCTSPWAEYAYVPAHGGGVTTDITHLVLANPHRLEAPLPWRAGRLGLWHPPPALLDELPELPA